MAHIHKSFDRLQATTGLKDVPTGWFGGGQPVHTKLARAEVHRDRGVPLLYCSDTYAADVPYWVKDPIAAVNGGDDKGMLMIPYSLCTNDHRCMYSELGCLSFLLTKFASLCCSRSRRLKARRLVRFAEV